MRTKKLCNAASTMAPLLVLLCVLPTMGQSRKSPDETQIDSLLTALSTSGDAKDLIDPAAPQRERDLKRLDEPHKLTLVASGPITVSGDRASVQARIYFQNAHSESEQSATIEFVKRNNRWYVANFDFLNTSLTLVFMFVCGIIFAVVYAAGVLRAFFLTLKSKQRKLQPIDFVRMYNPFTWFGRRG